MVYSLDNRAIGVFDSGLGGLTAVKELMHIMPNEDIIYFGDTGRVPYGTRSKETIIKYVSGDIRFLKTFDLKMIVVACGTASSVALPVLKDVIDIETIGVLGPAAKAAAAATKNNKIGIIATPSTIASHAYQDIIGGISKDITTFAAACPLFVPLVENGHTDSEVVRLVIKEYLCPLKKQGVDTLILGCTHYPLLKKAISEYMGDEVGLIDVGAECAKSAKSLLMQSGKLCSAEHRANYCYYVSDETENFEKLGSLFLQKKIEGLVKKIDIEKY